PVAADFNGDGKMDVAATNGNINSLSIVFGDGNGGFSPPVNYQTGNGPGYPYAADLNNDGRPDIVMPDYHGADFTVSINNGTSSQDNEPPIIAVSDVSADAVDPTGAPVSYSVSAVDNSGTVPSVSCSVPS